jgi:hypothetical protein
MSVERDLRLHDRLRPALHDFGVGRSGARRLVGEIVQPLEF